MSIVATVTVPAAEFPLGSVLEVDEDVTVTVETTVPTSESVVPYLWAPASVEDAFVDALESAPVVTDVSVVDEVGDHVLFRVTWDGRVNGFLEEIRATDAIVTGAVGTETRWTFRLRFSAYRDLSSFYTGCVDRGISVDLVHVHERRASGDDTRFGLTVPQQELLVAAYDAGYFDVPRRTTLVELGERLDISDSAVSQRLRRGLAALIESTIALETTPDGIDAVPTSPDDRLDTEIESDP